MFNLSSYLEKFETKTLIIADETIGLRNDLTK